jgi:polyisoprenoid-binding protein YceI
MKQLITTLIASLFATSAVAIERAAVQADKSSISFVGKQMGVPVNGRFPKFTAQLAFDPASPEAGQVNISIDLASIDAGSKDANDEVVGKDWFNVRMFPMATFNASGMKSLGGGKYEVSGPLTIKGRSQPISAVFTFKSEGNNGIFEGSFAVKRIDFAVGEGPWTDVSMVANDVQIHFRLQAALSASAPASAKAPVPTKSK